MISYLYILPKSQHDDVNIDGHLNFICVIADKGGKLPKSRQCCCWPRKWWENAHLASTIYINLVEKDEKERRIVICYTVLLDQNRNEFRENANTHTVLEMVEELEMLKIRCVHKPNAVYISNQGTKKGKRRGRRFMYSMLNDKRNARSQIHTQTANRWIERKCKFYFSWLSHSLFLSLSQTPYHIYHSI